MASVTSITESEENGETQMSCFHFHPVGLLLGGLFSIFVVKRMGEKKPITGLLTEYETELGDNCDF